MDCYVCHIDGPKIFASTVFFSESSYDRVWSLEILVKANQIIGFFTLYMTLALSMMLSVDLILMIQYPFDNNESRMKWYIIVSVILSLIPTILFNFDLGNTLVVDIASWTVITYVGVYLVIFIYSICFTLKKLSGPGISKETRSLILKRHVLTNVVYFVCNLYAFCNNCMFAKEEWEV